MLTDSTNKKATITVDEEEILAMSEKIQENRYEDYKFSASLDRYLSCPEIHTAPITIGKTPNALAIAGADPKINVVINPSTVKKCMSEPSEHFHGHGISAELLKQIPGELRNPTMIFKGSHENTLVTITELKDKENRGIIVAVSLSAKQGFSEVNKISSVYGKDNLTNYLKSQLSSDNLIAINKEKAEKMLHSTGLQLPEENTFLSFNSSIAYSMQNVKVYDYEKSVSQNISVPSLDEVYEESTEDELEPIF